MNNIKQKAEVGGLGKLATLYKKYKRWLFLAAGGALLASWYLQGIVITIFIALVVVLAGIFIKALWGIAQWVMKSKSDKIQQKRVSVIFITMACLAIVYFVIKYLFLPTSLGQSLQGFLYKTF